jgi:FixJ family two-component response regulator
MDAQRSLNVVDDDASVATQWPGRMQSAGWTVATFAWPGVPCQFRGTSQLPGIDVQLPGQSGLELQQHLAKSGARTSIIFLTGHGDIPTSVRAIKAGALEFSDQTVHRRGFDCGD